MNWFFFKREAYPTAYIHITAIFFYFRYLYLKILRNTVQRFTYMYVLCTAYLEVMMELGWNCLKWLRNTCSGSGHQQRKTEELALYYFTMVWNYFWSSKVYPFLKQCCGRPSVYSKKCTLADVSLIGLLKVPCFESTENRANTVLTSLKIGRDCEPMTF